MKPSTDQCLGHQRLASASNVDVQTATIPAGTSHVLIGVESNNVRMTLTSTGDPSSNTGLVVPKDQGPWFIAVGQGCTLKFASIDGNAAVVQLAYLQ